MTEKWDEIDRYVVISSDSHAGADLRDYKAYLSSEWHDEFDAWADAYGSPFDDLIHHTAHRNWDSDFRLEEQNADGVCTEMIVPNTIPPFFPTSAVFVVGLPKTAADFERRLVGVQAHNRWVNDFVSLAPLRRRGFVQIFPNDVDAAMNEIRWAVDQGTFGAALLAPVPPGHPVPGFNDPRYEPLWALCEELDFPIATHNVAVPEIPLDAPGGKALAMFSVHLWAEFTLMQLIVGGVFERHPNLKWVPTESQWDAPLRAAGMLDFTLGASRGADNRTMGMFGDETTRGLTKLPSEYVKQNLWYGVSVGFGPDTFTQATETVGVDRIMWGSDYPHEEGSSPQSKLAIRWAFNDVPVEDTRQMLAGNAARLYNIDLEALVPIAKEIGPLVSEVHRPITADDADFDGKVYTADFIPRPFPGGSLLMRGREADAKF